MTYAALDSLAKHLDDIMDHQFSSPDIEHCIQRLHENIIFLLIFHGEFPREAEDLEARVTNAAHQAKNLLLNLGGTRFYNVFANLFKWFTQQPQVFADQSSTSFCQELENLIVETEEAMQIQISRKIRMPSRLAGDGNDTVVGIEEDLLEIKSRLWGGSSRLGIIPIVGMGGIGKTTLARYDYDYPLSVHHFDVRVWLTISQSYNLYGIIGTVLRSLKNVYGEFLGDKEDWYVDNELLKEKVYKYLKGRRYLIVIDDMWDTKLWDDVRMMFPDESNGSRIIITTRELNVASYIDSLIYPHQMRLMAVDQSWSLLKQRVFGQENCPPEFEKIGQIIAYKCQGLPLAIVVIAGVLSSKANQTKDSWENIARNVSKVVYTNDDKYIEILSLSYTYLPCRLRRCFMYMGCFPEDYEISVSKLIRLWAAEGFLASKDMEELRYEYLEDLARRSLVFMNKKGSDGRIRSVKIHDLLRDLCLRICRDDNFLCTINDFSGSYPQGMENSNRLSIFCNVYKDIPNMKSSHIRTILLFEHWAFDCWKSFRQLRVLNVLCVTLISFSSVECIGELVHLRYLALTCEPIRKILTLLSESLYQLHNLRTLIVRVSDHSVYNLEMTSCRIEISEIDLEFSSSNDEYLNEFFMKFEIWRMPNLRHLILLDGFLPDLSEESFQQISSMKNLHTLSRIKDFKCSKRLVEMMSNLKNDLSQNIAYPITLKKLNLSGCRLPWEHMRMIGLLPNLQVLKLKRRACHGTQWETSEGEFCQLKVLLIDSTDLHQWITQSSYFPKLERLTLYECDNLREVPYDIGEISTLELIEVDIRNSTMVESAKCIEEEQQSYGNELMQVRFLKSRSWVNFT